MKMEFKKSSNILSNKTFDNIAIYSRELDCLIEELVKANTAIKYEINRPAPNIKFLNNVIFHCGICVEISEGRRKII